MNRFGERAAAPAGPWPAAPVEGWLETCGALQMWAQMVGKVKLARAPFVNHWWNVALYVSARGLTTGAIPDAWRAFQIDFDLFDHRLVISTSDGTERELALTARPLRDFYGEFLARLDELGIRVPIRPVAVETPEVMRFTEDRGYSGYDPGIATRFFEILLRADQVMKEFRGGFCGKSSPVHFFWGGFDHAVTRFSGRPAPLHPGGVPNVADWVMWEAYSHEVSSCGFWPGTPGVFERPAFYAYAYPEPEGFAGALVRPKAAFYHPEMREFLLPYDNIRGSPDPGVLVREFLDSTYKAAAELGRWRRAELER